MRGPLLAAFRRLFNLASRGNAAFGQVRRDKTHRPIIIDHLDKFVFECLMSAHPFLGFSVCRTNRKI